MISKKTLTVFSVKHPQSKVALGIWYKKMNKSSPQSVSDVKRIFSSTDYVGNDRFVFNICGNKYRIIVKINYEHEVIRIRFVGTHKKYDSINAGTI